MHDAKLQRFLSHFMKLRCGTVCICCGVREKNSQKSKKRKRKSLWSHSQGNQVCVSIATSFDNSDDWWVCALTPNTLCAMNFYVFLCGFVNRQPNYLTSCAQHHGHMHSKRLFVGESLRWSSGKLKLNCVELSFLFV